MLRMRAGKVLGKGTPSEISKDQLDIMIDIPILLGNICSLSTLLCTHAIRCSMYSGADILVGRLKFSLSSHRYSNL